MKTTKQINIKNQTYYFYNDIFDIEVFDSNMLKLDKKPTKNMLQLKKLVMVMILIV